jgi:acyl-coenzyme A thioesterase PaaI-like protein
MSAEEQVREEMLKLGVLAKAAGIELILPPPVWHELGCEFIGFEPEKKLIARVPFNPRFTNPIGAYQGGLITAAMDNVWGPLSYMALKGPCVTVEMGTTFVRPFLAADEFMEVTASVTALTKNLAFMEGRATSVKSGKLLAFGRTQCMRVEARTPKS